MRLCVFLVFVCVLLPTVCGIRCFTCWDANPGHCNDVWICAPHLDRCATTIVAENRVTKECMRSDMCDNVNSNGLQCCSGDLCNGDYYMLGSSSLSSSQRQRSRHI